MPGLYAGSMFLSTNLSQAIGIAHQPIGFLSLMASARWRTWASKRYFS